MNSSFAARLGLGYKPVHGTTIILNYNLVPERAADGTEILVDLQYGFRTFVDQLFVPKSVRRQHRPDPSTVLDLPLRRRK